MVKYLAIYKKIKQRILDDKYSKNQKLPDGKKLALEFDCSELTIKKALDMLVMEGFIVRKRGSGSYIKRPDNNLSSEYLNGTKNHFENLGKKVTTKVIHFNATQADQSIADKLRCSVGDLIYNIIRVREIDGVPTIVEYSYIPTSVISGLTIKHLEESLYDYIHGQLKLRVHSSDMKVSIAEANETEQGYLALSTPENLAVVEQVAFLDNGQLFEYSINKHLWHSFEFTTTYVKI